MAARCKICNRAVKKSQPTIHHEIHGCIYTVHHACRDMIAPKFKNAEKHWDYRTLTRKNKRA
jgi:hypothetical protein